MGKPTDTPFAWRKGVGCVVNGTRYVVMQGVKRAGQLGIHRVYIDHKPAPVAPFTSLAAAQKWCREHADKAKGVQTDG